MSEFLSPYAVGKVLSGVLEALPLSRPNWMQTFFGNGFQTSERQTINFDRQYGIKNVMGQFVAPEADATPIQLGNFDTTEFYFSYAKEGWTDDSFTQINQRQLGDQFGVVNPLANAARRLQDKMVEAEHRFENLFEQCAVNIALYGGYEAVSEKHPRVRYNFNRTVATAYTDFQNPLMPSVNLTTTAVTAPWDSTITIMPVVATGGTGTWDSDANTGTYTAGMKAWTKALVTAGTATPVKDLVKMYATALKRTNLEAFHMSDDAYIAFNFDVETNYFAAATTTVSSIVSIQRDIIPRAQQVQGLTFRRMWTFDNGANLPIYTYNAVYHDRTTGVQTPYIGSGWVIGLPVADNGIKIYGRIMHPDAQYSAMPRWVNSWKNSKTGKWEWEEHTSFMMGHTQINALVSWKVK